MGIFSWRKKKKKEQNGHQDAGTEMSFFDHLEELRWHLVRVLIAVASCGVFLFIYREYLLSYILELPFDGRRFPTYRFLCNHFSDSFCFDRIPIEKIALSPSENFLNAMIYAFFGGVIIAFPYIAWELWRFIKPALEIKEVRKVRWNVVLVSFLFFTGIAFGYFVILPFSIKFFSSFVLVPGIENQWRVSKIMSLVLMILLGAGFLFQMPVVVYYLSKIGLIGPAFLKRYRKHAIVILLVIAAMITPPDPFTQILIFLPLWVLYEIGIFISKRVVKRQKKEAASD